MPHLPHRRADAGRCRRGDGLRERTPLILMALPMLVIANCYRRLNLWNANCGAAFEWVGRVINPYVGFMTGWLMIMAGVIGTVSTAVVLGPSVLTVFGSTSSSSIPPNLAIDTVVILGMLLIAIVGVGSPLAPRSAWQWWSMRSSLASPSPV